LFDSINSASFRPVRAENLVLCIADCAGVSGHSYGAEGPVLDVTGRPH
jgi:hypothetical protein